MHAVNHKASSTEDRVQSERHGAPVLVLLDFIVVAYYNLLRWTFIVCLLQPCIHPGVCTLVLSSLEKRPFI